MIDYLKTLEIRQLNNLKSDDVKSICSVSCSYWPCKEIYKNERNNILSNSIKQILKNDITCYENNRKIYCDATFDIYLHREDTRILTPISINKCCFSNYFFFSERFISFVLNYLDVEYENYYIVIPVNNSYKNFPKILADDSSIYFKKGYHSDIQTMVTGKCDWNDEKMEDYNITLLREIGEEIGLNVESTIMYDSKNIVRYEKNIDTKFYLSKLKNEPALKIKSSGKSNKETRIATIPIIKNMEDIYYRQRSKSDDRAGQVVAILNVSNYVSFLSSYIQCLYN
jgi:hypothetical protein